MSTCTLFMMPVLFVTVPGITGIVMFIASSAFFAHSWVHRHRYSPQSQSLAWTARAGQALSRAITLLGKAVHIQISCVMLQICMMCSPGTYNIDIDSSCKPCPTGAVCLGGDSFSADRNYWQLGVRFYRCMDDKCCQKARIYESMCLVFCCHGR
jgi:hypothetical protein